MGRPTVGHRLQRFRDPSRCRCWALVRQLPWELCQPHQLLVARGCRICQARRLLAEGWFEKVTEKHVYNTLLSFGTTQRTCYHPLFLFFHVSTCFLCQKTMIHILYILFGSKFLIIFKKKKQQNPAVSTSGLLKRHPSSPAAGRAAGARRRAGAGGAPRGHGHRHQHGAAGGGRGASADQPSDAGVAT